VERTFPALKAKPELIPGVLRIVADNRGSYSKIEEAVVSFWRQRSNRRKPPTSRNAVRAVFGPTLRHLRLIRGERDEIRLLPPGKSLLEQYERHKEPGYKKWLARHLVKLDRDEWLNALGYLKEANNTCTFAELLHGLQSKAPGSGANEERLLKFLLYCEYVGLLSITSGTVTLRSGQYRISMRSGYKRLSDKQFFKLLDEEYESLRSQAEGSPYVPIPDVRDRVCERGVISLADFDEKLKTMPKESAGYVIQLSQPMLRKPDGIIIGGKYLYYMAIYKKGRG
jgi:hypothetical protein